MSRNDLLDILSNGNNPVRVMRHMSKCFQAIERLTLDTETPEPGKRPRARGMVSCVGVEEVPFQSELALENKVESYMSDMVQKMRTELRAILSDSIKAYGVKKRHEWLFDWPSQLILVVSQIFWCQASGYAACAPKRTHTACGPMRTPASVHMCRAPPPHVPMHPHPPSPATLAGGGERPGQGRFGRQGRPAHVQRLPGGAADAADRGHAHQSEQAGPSEGHEHDHHRRPLARHRGQDGRRGVRPRGRLPLDHPGENGGGGTARGIHDAWTALLHRS